jgi:lipopolysaccharide transport system ATP-binding protein
MRPIIRVENLSKRYTLGEREAPYRTIRETLSRAVRAPFGRRNSNVSSPDRTIWALKGISFEVQPGEILGIIGRNGAGKSTLLKMLSRITEPTTGRIELYGRLGSLLEVGTGFHPELTGRENVYLNGAILGMKRSEIEHRFDEIIAFAEIEKFLDTPVKHYSSGMYMRLAFAVAAYLEPEILVVDEVLAVGDSEFQKKCLGKMGEISKEGRTVLLVSHNMPSIINLCQRTILLNSGEIVAMGRPAEIVQNYLSLARSDGGEVVWSDPQQAPGNETVRLLAVRILQEGIEGPTADVDISKEVLVQITYQNLLEGSPLYSGFWLKDQMGTFVLSSGNAPSVSLTNDPWYGQPHPCGVFQSVCRIPGNFLNEGPYNISPFVGKVPNKVQILEDGILSFHVHDTGEMRKEYLGQWAGTVRPRFSWHTQSLGPATEVIDRKADVPVESLIHKAQASDERQL